MGGYVGVRFIVAVVCLEWTGGWRGFRPDSMCSFVQVKFWCIWSLVDTLSREGSLAYVIEDGSAFSLHLSVVLQFGLVACDESFIALRRVVLLELFKLGTASSGWSRGLIVILLLAVYDCETQRGS
ncbi:Uncharacterized protein TCM_000941 [Theobroma cacao]|uniref:Secreted protein n=1 Tax=Theobroma cacao TaxID=3641 RepID=A0A061DHH3_THECC|nr:Uncharacterized protein TCM_000941 [Theobroma cacao]